jgi:hypothetical protein
LTSPRRIAVVILAAFIGFALETWASVPDATVNAVLLGMLGALLVPTGNRSCRVR